jgi:hypothetical protein
MLHPRQHKNTCHAPRLQHHISTILKPQLANQCHTSIIWKKHHGTDILEAEVMDEVVEERGRGFSPVALVLVFWSEDKADILLLTYLVFNILMLYHFSDTERKGMVARLLTGGTSGLLSLSDTNPIAGPVSEAK